MTTTINGVTGELVISKDECAYLEVLESFPSAKTITILTFNISDGQCGLLKALKESDAEVRLITNIPKRFPRYTYPHNKTNARTAIHRYLATLDPVNFNLTTRISFCFENHIKIIMTESVGYLGSANFSEASARNWEGGIIIRDSSILVKLAGIVDVIEADSFRYYGKSMIDAVAPLLAIRARLLDLHEQMFDEEQPSIEELNMESVEHGRQVIEDLNDLVGNVDSAWAEAHSMHGPIVSKVDVRALRDVEDFLGSDELWDLADATTRYSRAMNGDIDAGELRTDRDGNIPESEFEKVVDASKGEVDRLFELMEDSYLDFGKKLATISTQIESVCEDISDHIAKINNTN